MSPRQQCGETWHLRNIQRETCESCLSDLLVPHNGGKINSWRVGDLEINFACFTISLLLTGRNMKDKACSNYTPVQRMPCFGPTNEGHTCIIILQKTLVFLLLFPLLSTGIGCLIFCVPVVQVGLCLSTVPRRISSLTMSLGWMAPRELSSLKNLLICTYPETLYQWIFFLSSLPVQEYWCELPTLLEQWKQRCTSFLIKGTLYTQVSSTNEKYKTTIRRAGWCPGFLKKATLRRVYERRLAIP